MKKATKKLILAPVVVSQLSENQMQEVNGGQNFNTINICESCQGGCDQPFDIQS